MPLLKAAVVIVADAPLARFVAVRQMRTLEARDPATTAHAARVRRWCMLLADAIGLDAPRRRQLSLAARFHDIGKVGMPAAIVYKPGPLTSAEQAVIREHPVLGERLLRPHLQCPTTLAAIRHHHERLDGRGYPDGLRGERVPLLARLLAIADCFDALTTVRSYRAALPVEEATAILRSGAGSHFDAALVRAFLPVCTAHDKTDPEADFNVSAPGSV